MAVTSGFFNSSNGDRRYTAEQFSALIDNLITDGVFATVGTAFSVEASGSAINIGVGRAWFNSVWVYNDASLPLAALSAEQLQNRIDAVVIEINHTESVRAGSIKMVRGTPTNTPTNPALVNTESVHQYPLAYIYRPAGQSEVLAEDITNMIGTSACPFVTGILQTINIESLFTQWQGEFDTWFSGLEDMLDGDQATALAARILDLEGQMRDLAMERAVYDVLSDSSDDDIQDSTGAPIEVATRFSETSSGGEIIPATPTSDGFKVGDIRETMQTDLGPEWLLCNGDVVTLADYPALRVLGGMYNGPWIPCASGYTVASGRNYRPIKYLNGRFVVASGSSTIEYSQHPESSWSKNSNVGAASDASGVWVYEVWYANGYYFVGFYYSRDSNNDTYYCLSHGNSLSGSFVKNFEYYASRSHLIKGVVYLNGQYVALKASHYSSEFDYLIMTRSALSSGDSWNREYTLPDRHNDSYNDYASLYVIDNRLVAYFNFYHSQYYNTLVYYTAKNKVPTSSSGWTQVSVDTNTDTGTRYGKTSDILEHNGMYYIVRIKNEDLILYYTDDITKNGWDSKIIYKEISGVMTDTMVYSFIHDGVNYIIGFEDYILSSPSLDGPWLISSYDTDTTIGVSVYGAIACGNDQFVVGNADGLHYLDRTKRKLPTLSSDGKTYKYIKAKE